MSAPKHRYRVGLSGRLQFDYPNPEIDRFPRLRQGANLAALSHSPIALCFLAYVYTTATETVRADITGELTACALGSIWFWFGTRYAQSLRSSPAPRR